MADGTDGSPVPARGDPEPDYDDPGALADGVQRGDRRALEEFYRRYSPALERLAARNISPGMRRRFSAESVVQSVCRTFMRRAQDGTFEVTGGDALWRLLCVISLNKVRERVRFHRRERRTTERERPLSVAADLPARSGAGPLEHAVFRDHLDHVVASLDDEERRVLELRLLDHTQVEIAEQLGCSERTVRRMLGRLETRLHELLAA